MAMAMAMRAALRAAAAAAAALVVVVLALAPTSAEGLDICNAGAVLSGRGLVSAAAMLRPPTDEGLETRHSAATVRGLERALVGGGAHREVRTAVTLALEPARTTAADSCELLLLEHLSAGVFADPFQLHRLQQRGALKYAHVYGDVDLERPARKSFESVVELRQRLVAAKDDGVEILYQSTVALPLHARYPPTGSDSHVWVNITLPHILVHCKAEEDAADRSGNLKREQCIYAQLDDELSKMPPNSLQWSVPAGYSVHAAWVGRLTTSAGLAGALAIFVASQISVSRRKTETVPKQKE